MPITTDSNEFLDVAAERICQIDKWGVQSHHAYKWLAILIEEVGEVGKAILENAPPSAYRAELVQVAAVALAAIESLDRVGMLGEDEAAGGES